MVRNSERSDFTQCRQKWQWAYVDRLRPPELGMNPLIFGDIVHRSLSGWYIPETNRKKCVRGVPPAVTCEKIFDALESERHPVSRGSDFEDFKELGIGMLEGYVKRYGLDEEYMVIYPEMPFQYDLYIEGKYLCTLVGTTDNLVRWRSTMKLGLQEHKTAAQISTEHLFVDEQANTYWTILPLWLREQGIIKPDEDITFMDYNFLKKTVIADDRPKNAQGLYLNQPTVAAMTKALVDAKVEFRKAGMKKEDFIALCEESGVEWKQLGKVSATQGSDLFYRERVYRNDHQRLRTMHRIISQVREMQMVRHGKLEVYKEPSKSCVWCQYKDLCEMDEYGSDTEELIKHGYQTWNPYRDHIWSMALA
jgi:hypothetical protein